MNKTLVIIEDDKSLQSYLKELFVAEGYSIKTLEDGTKAMETIEKVNPGLVILDLGLPLIKGESVLLQLKKEWPNLPTIILTGKSAPLDKINAFETGADDYVTKPFVSEELLLRVKARLRDNTPANHTLKVDDLEMNTESMEVKRAKRKISLTPQEYKLLEHLMINKDKVLSRETLLNRIWPNSFDIETRVVDVYISYLRKKIDKGFKKKLIRSIRGFGYSIR
jgi:two-component system, OmpR family, copper resistance phosphate regulon response regulator CusR